MLRSAPVRRSGEQLGRWRYLPCKRLKGISYKNGLYNLQSLLLVLVLVLVVVVVVAVVGIRHPFSVILVMTLNVFLCLQ